jgi:hypothetical protein
MRFGQVALRSLLPILFLASSVVAQQWDWVRRFQGDASLGQAIGLDGSGDVYVAGTFTGILQTGTNRLVSAGSNDVFIAKINHDGAVLWIVSTGGPGDDSIRSLVVTTNGTLFVSGHFSIPPSLLGAPTNVSTLVSNVFLARMDDGKFAWFDALPAGTGGTSGGIAFGPDESLWLVAATNRAFVRNYTQSGTVRTGYSVGEDLFTPIGIAVSASGNVFVHGSARGFAGSSLNLGTTNLSTEYGINFIAGLNATGRVEWAWYPNPDLYGGPQIRSLASTPDGGVISVGGGSFANGRFGIATRHSADGIVRWSKWLQHPVVSKYFYDANGVTVNARGDALIAGAVLIPYQLWASRRSIWLPILNQTGDVASEQFIRSYAAYDDNIGNAIVANRDGDIFVTGQLMGTPTFGTNIMAAGPSGVTNAFVGRRATVQPPLTILTSGTNLLLNWPRTSLPFALQQRTDVSTGNWEDVWVPPLESENRREVRLPTLGGNRFFRLMKTNEVAIEHLPVIFLPEPYVRVTSSNTVSGLAITAVAQDDDQDSLTFQWFNADTGQSLTNGASVYLDHDGQDYYPRYWPQIGDSTLTFGLGTHTISLVAFDGVFRATNSLTFEVLSVPSAISRLIRNVELATRNPEETRLVTPLYLARDAAEGGGFVAAAQELQEFKTRVETTTELTASTKALFLDSAQKILNALPGG